MQDEVVARDAKQSFAEVRSQAELGNEGSRKVGAVQFVVAASSASIALATSLAVGYIAALA